MKTTDVKVTVRGNHWTEDEDADDIEVISMGKMYKKDGFICVSYDEVTEACDNGVAEATINTVRFNDDQVEIIKKGPAASHMIFVPGRCTYTYYSTPFGELEVSIYTKELKKEISENSFWIQLRYDLEMNQVSLSRSNVRIEVEF